MAATHAQHSHWLGKALGVTAALIFAPTAPPLLLAWLIAGLAAGQLLDSCTAHLYGQRPFTGARRRKPPPGQAGAGKTGSRSQRGRTEPPAREVAREAPAARAREVLGVPAGADPAAIKLAYRRLVSRCHPDRLPRSASEAERRLAGARMTELRDALEAALAANGAGDQAPGG